MQNAECKLKNAKSLFLFRKKKTCAKRKNNSFFGKAFFLKERYFKQFIAIARGSCAELETQIIIAHKLGFIQEDNINNLSSKVEELSKMLSSFYSKINSKPPTC